jgi:hypothetical protein
MIILTNSVDFSENYASIYSSLAGISGKGRKQLKEIAESLIAIQRNPGGPVPDSIAKEIMKNPTDELA